MKLNTLVLKTLPLFPRCSIRLVSGRYIAGDTLEKAISTVKKIGRMGAMATLDVLGEFVQEKKEVEEMVLFYRKALEAIEKHKLNSGVSIKLTSFGALIDDSLCEESVRNLVSMAREMGNFVRIDMENHPFTDLTLRIYKNLRKEFPHNVGTVVQAYLKRTQDDVSSLLQEGKTDLRLCKGIYVEPPEIAYQEKQKINENYLKVLEELFSRGAYVAIATHDNALVLGAQHLIEKYGLGPERYEFQMLLGVRSALAKRILQKGHRLRIYVPFGRDWYPYSMRRLNENPAIVGDLLKGFLPRFITREKLPF